MAPTDSIAGTSHPGEGVGVPVVDLTATVQGIYAHAESAREQAHGLEQWAARYVASIRRRADYLEDLASILSSGVPRG